MGIWRNDSRHTLLWERNGPTQPQEQVAPGELVEIADHLDGDVESLLGVDNMTKLGAEEIEDALIKLQEQRLEAAKARAAKTAETDGEGGDDGKGGKGVSSKPATAGKK